MVSAHPDPILECPLKRPRHMAQVYQWLSSRNLKMNISTYSNVVTAFLMILLTCTPSCSPKCSACICPFLIRDLQSMLCARKILACKCCRTILHSRPKSIWRCFFLPQHDLTPACLCRFERQFFTESKHENQKIRFFFALAREYLGVSRELSLDSQEENNFSVTRCTHVLVFCA
jgi:hypothetical protein